MHFFNESTRVLMPRSVVDQVSIHVEYNYRICKWKMMIINYAHCIMNLEVGNDQHDCYQKFDVQIINGYDAC